MTDPELVKIARLEIEVQHLKATIDKMAEAHEKTAAHVDEIRSIVLQAKGSWKTLVAVSSISGVAGAFLVKVAPFLMGLPK